MMNMDGRKCMIQVHHQMKARYPLHLAHLPMVAQRKDRTEDSTSEVVKDPEAEVGQPANRGIASKGDRPPSSNSKSDR